MGIHPAVQALFNRIGKNIRRHGDDGHRRSIGAGQGSKGNSKTYNAVIFNSDFVIAPPYFGEFRI